MSPLALGSGLNLVTNSGLASRLFWVGARLLFALPKFRILRDYPRCGTLRVGRRYFLKGEVWTRSSSNFLGNGSRLSKACKLRPRKKTSSQRTRPTSSRGSPRRLPRACAGVVVKLGLHQFLNDYADAASVQVDSAYADLVRLTGHDPATEICNWFDRERA